jgi:hypothetical protein
VRKARSQKRAGAISLICSAMTLAVILFAPWKPRADFDVTGVLWLMQNILSFIIVCSLFVFASGALLQWLRLKFKDNRK